MQSVEAILDFWFQELKPAQHWQKDPELDARISMRFGAVHRAALAGECWQWRQNVAGRLAEIIVLDQFSRNIHRDTPMSFAADSMALVLAQEAVALDLARQLVPEQRSFLYMPYMHSESLLIHDEAMRLFAEPGMENNYDFEVKHRDIIARFGRYPHRNAILGRTSTPEEEAFLRQPGSSF